MIQLAMYKGPPVKDLVHRISHAVTCRVTSSIYSHGELVINDKCYSSSARDGGVRPKEIDLTTGRWDIYGLRGGGFMEVNALRWFAEHKGEKYDYLGAFGLVLPRPGWLNVKSRQFCFEAIAAMLYLPRPAQYNAKTLLQEIARQGMFRAEGGK